MTGFGNFSYYYIRRDFSVGRFCQVGRTSISIYVYACLWETLLLQPLWFLCILTDDVAAQLSCILGLYLSWKLVDALLHLPNAHSFHRPCICNSGSKQ